MMVLSKSQSETPAQEPQSETPAQEPQSVTEPHDQLQPVCTIPKLDTIQFS